MTYTTANTISRKYHATPPIPTHARPDLSDLVIENGYNPEIWVQSKSTRVVGEINQWSLVDDTYIKPAPRRTIVTLIAAIFS